MRKSEEYFGVPWRQKVGSGGVVSSTVIFGRIQLTNSEDSDQRYPRNRYVATLAGRHKGGLCNGGHQRAAIRSRLHGTDHHEVFIRSSRVILTIRVRLFHRFVQSFWKLTATINFSTTVSPHSWESATGENPNFPVTGEPSLTIFGSQGTIDVPSL